MKECDVHIIVDNCRSGSLQSTVVLDVFHNVFVMPSVEWNSGQLKFRIMILSNRLVVDFGESPDKQNCATLCEKC